MKLGVGHGQSGLLCPRAASLHDVERIVSHINLAFAQENPFMLKERTDAEEIAELIQKGNFLLLEEEGAIQGLIYVELHDGRSAYLGLLAVHPSRRRRGLGRHLLRAAEEFCSQRGHRKVHITTVSLRPDLVDRYQRFGFRIVGEVFGYFPNHIREDFNSHKDGERDSFHRAYHVKYQIEPAQDETRGSWFGDKYPSRLSCYTRG